ncbi:ParB N-terminal domain-containing protein [uncultured Oscillibacter sp.]|uniref:ParB N-terminal domain-containing protein n=1 Tax=uncultured Oscillibacter sp. TaxID=876091 RepID=UPI002805D115|nr:ParB N-terminal domain-containing protein [uncultured Oscillibacter sp.]
MAEEPSKTPGTSAERPSPQIIPLSKIHDLPGVFIPKQPDKSYGGLVSSIQASGVKEPVILRQREDGEYQLVAGYRRRRGSELAKKQDIPAFVYEMTLQEAVDYHRRVQNQPALPIPGKLVKPTVEKKTEQPAPAAVSIPKEPAMGKTEGKPDGKTADAPKETAPAKDSPATKEGKVTPPAADTPKPKEKPTESKPEAKPDAKTADAPKETTPAKDGPTPRESKETPATPAAGTPKPKEQPAEGKTEAKPDGKAADTPKESKEAPATPAASTPKPKEQPTEGKTEAKPDGKIADTPKETAPAKDGPAPASDTPKSKEQPAVGKTEAKPDGKTTGIPKETVATKDAPAATPKPKEPVESKIEVKPIVTGPTAKGPAGTQITQVFEDRLAPPDEKALNDLPSPKEGESYFIVLHPGYLEKSKYNTITVDRNSEDYRELKKSIELNGVKDPVLTRINPEGGGLEIVSGQRRHMIAKELNYPVPAIIQKLDDADVKILVNDGNLHRPHISTYDLARALRGKMEGMKQKAGRKKKGAPTAEELNSDEKLAQEMGMSVSKLNRIIRLSEASKDVCDRVDDGSLPLSVASAISFLKPQNQDEVLHLNDLGYKLSTERIEYMKKVEKACKLDENSMRLVLEGENVLEPPKVVPMPQPAPTAPAQSQPGAKPDAQGEPSLPPSPDLKPQPEQPKPSPQEPVVPPTPAPAPAEPGKQPDQHPAKETAEQKGEQDRPEYTKVILAGDRLRKYFPDVTMTPREIEESIYDALEERRQRLEKKEQKKDIFKKGPTR